MADKAKKTQPSVFKKMGFSNILDEAKEVISFLEDQEDFEDDDEFEDSDDEEDEFDVEINPETDLESIEPGKDILDAGLDDELDGVKDQVESIGGQLKGLFD